MTARRMISLLSGLIALVAAGGFIAHTQMQSSIDPNGCGRCHNAELAGFALSAMSHSMRPGAEEPTGKVQVPGTTITISSSPAGSSQRWESGDKASDYHVDYVIGSTPVSKPAIFFPATPLEDTYTVYRNSMPPGTAAKFRVISHVEQLALK